MIKAGSGGAQVVDRLMPQVIQALVGHGSNINDQQQKALGKRLRDW